MSSKEAFARANETIRAWEQGRSGPIKILEAGGGSYSRVEFTLDREITVIDISPEQLERNLYAKNKILGDLHMVDVRGHFDVIICFDVIEHLEAPGLVVRRMCEWLSPGGILILAAPNRSSLSGIITRLSPHWFHVFVYRHVFGHPNAGKPGYAPFEVYHHPDIDTTTLADNIKAQPGMSIAAFLPYESTRRDTIKRNRPVIGALYDLVLGALTSVFGTRLAQSDFFLLASKEKAVLSQESLSSAR